MATTHTLEGPDLEALLARVPAEHGSDAVIVAANKLRTGGLGGFFTKEAFEVVVEVPARLEPPVITAAPPRGATTRPPSTQRISTDAVGFAGVLERMVRDAGIEDEAPRPIGPALARSQHPPSSLDSSPPTSVVRSTASPLGATTDEHHRDEHHDDEFLPLQPLAVARRTAADRTPPPSLRSDLAIHPSLDQRWLAQIGLPTGIAARLTTVSQDPVIELLHLMEQLTRPDPLPTGTGSVIVVIGHHSQALEVCERFAEQVGVNPEEVVVAAPSFVDEALSEDRRLTSVDLAREQRRSWRRRGRPTLIALEAPLGRARSAWATHLLEAVEPTMVWGIVEASQKAEDIRDWARRLGGLDALAVTGLDDTVSPATVLGAGVPVGLLDGHEATASRWTAVLAEHLEVAA